MRARLLRAGARIISVWLPVLVATGSAWAQAAADAPAEGSRRFRETGEWSVRLDSELRDRWQKPDEVIRALELKRTSVVADIGAGTGYFAVRLARALPEGRVYAVDIETEMVGHLRGRAEREAIANLHAVQGGRDDPRLPEAVDLALLVNVQGLMVRPGDYFARLRQSLRPGGRVAIISTRLDAPIGPPGNMRVSPETVKKDMADKGYLLVSEHEFLPYQFFLVFTPKR